MNNRQISAIKRIAANFAATITLGLLVIVAILSLLNLASQ